MNKLSTILLSLIAASAVTIVVTLVFAPRPLKTGVLNGAILFNDSYRSQADVGSSVEFYESFVVVTLFGPDAKNQAKEVYPMDQIRVIPLK